MIKHTSEASCFVKIRLAVHVSFWTALASEVRTVVYCPRFKCLVGIVGASWGGIAQSLCCPWPSYILWERRSAVHRKQPPIKCWQWTKGGGVVGGKWQSENEVICTMGVADNWDIISPPHPSSSLWSAPCWMVHWKFKKGVASTECLLEHWFPPSWQDATGELVRTWQKKKEKKDND